MTAKVDFEQGLIKAVRDEFAPDDPSAVGGCFFHWKQLLRRKLVDLRVPSEIIHRLMDELIDFLTILLYDEVPKGIAYIRSRMQEGQFNERIPRHPTVQVLVSILKDISNEYVDLMKDIRLRRYKQKRQSPVPIPVLPADFASFKFK